MSFGIIHDLPDAALVDIGDIFGDMYWNVALPLQTPITKVVKTSIWSWLREGQRDLLLRLQIVNSRTPKCCTIWKCVQV